MAKIFVGNLPYWTKDGDLRSLFAPFGHISSAHVSTDFSGRSKGYGFVEMPDLSEAAEAVDQLQGREISGLPLSVQIVLRNSVPHRSSMSRMGFSPRRGVSHVG